MKAFTFLLFSSAILPLDAVSQDTWQDSKVTFAHVHPDSALVDAAESYSGDLFVYFYREGDEHHEAVVTNAFARDSLSSFINSEFARVAVETSTPEGLAILARYRPDLPDWAFVVVLQAGKSGRTGLHGWANIEDDDDEQRFLSWLQQLKAGEDMFGELRRRLKGPEK